MGFLNRIIDIYITINQFSHFIPFIRNDYYRQIIVKRQEIIKNMIKFIYFNNLYLLLHKNHKKAFPLRGRLNGKHILLPDIDGCRMLHFCGLRHLHHQYAILEFCIDPAFIDIVDVEGTAHRTHAAFPADVIALIILVARLALLLGGNGQITVLVTEVHILFLHPRQICGEFVMVAIILHIYPHTAAGTEVGHRGEEIIMEERFIEYIPDTARSITCCQILATAKWNQTKHNQQPLSHIYRSRELAVPLLTICNV